MTIGPEPITSTCLMSSRRGISGFSMSSTNRSNRSAASCGPAAASGWYCTLNAGTSSARRPSTQPSLGQVWVISAGPNGLSHRSPASPCTANPWFCDVIATRPVACSTTGMLMPRWP